MKGYTCLLLDQRDRDRILSIIIPEYEVVIAHHITLQYGVKLDAAELPKVYSGFIVGEIMDKGVQTVVVSINGTTDHPHGGTYHITWSLDRERFPENSKQLLLRGWWPLVEPIPISVTPAFIASRPVGV